MGNLVGNPRRFGDGRFEIDIQVSEGDVAKSDAAGNPIESSPQIVTVGIAPCPEGEDEKSYLRARIEIAVAEKTQQLAPPEEIQL